CCLPEVVLRGCDGELRAHLVGEARRLRRRQLLQARRRVLHRELLRDDARGLVVGVRRGVRVVRAGWKRLAQDQEQGKGRHGRRPPDQAVPAEAIEMEGRVSGIAGTSSGYGSVSVTARNPTESSRPEISSPTSSP